MPIDEEVDDDDDDDDVGDEHEDEDDKDDDDDNDDGDVVVVEDADEGDVLEWLLIRASDDNFLIESFSSITVTPPIDSISSFMGEVNDKGDKVALLYKSER